MAYVSCSWLVLFNLFGRFLVGPALARSRQITIFEREAYRFTAWGWPTYTIYLPIDECAVMAAVASGELFDLGCLAALPQLLQTLG